GGGGPFGAGTPPNAGPDFVPYTSPVDFMLQSNGLSAIGPPWSQITAYDLNTGEIEWQIPNGEVAFLAAQGITGTGSHAPRGGPVATAGGLLFVGTSSDRAFRAYDRDTGEVLWKYELDGATEGVPAVCEVGGRQVITVASGRKGRVGPSCPGVRPRYGRGAVEVRARRGDRGRSGGIRGRRPAVHHDRERRQRALRPAQQRSAGAGQVHHVRAAGRRVARALELADTHGGPRGPLFLPPAERPRKARC